MLIYNLSMVRNDADVAILMLRQTDALFDKHVIVDVRSSDGTRQILDAHCRSNSKYSLLTVDVQEKYQAAMMNRLARSAFEDGADWVFLMDADEYINVNTRSDLERVLTECQEPVVGLPWINLVPSKYGVFDRFEHDQIFRWSGRLSPFKKVAISKLLPALYPNFYIVEGNHDVLSRPGHREIHAPIIGTLLHIPIRSSSRLRHRLASSAQLLKTKHNTTDGEGSHVGATLARLAEEETCRLELDGIAGFYGALQPPIDVDPEGSGWPEIRLPDFLRSGADPGIAPRSLLDTAAENRKIQWRRPNFVKGSMVRADIENGAVKIVPQPVKGSGELVYAEYGGLPAGSAHLPGAADVDTLTKAVAASFSKIDHWTFSAWSELVPTLFALMAVVRPRRYVELGVHNGMSFFGACQISEALAIGTDCVAIDSWLGDPHASFHSEDVFNTFRDVLRQKYPSQAYIRAFFAEASKCFADGSIDLLHIDGYHSYEAVKEDFETWLPKMSETGVIIFHDINVHERGFGVWRYWEELKQNYPTISLYHCHGLGVLYAGSADNVVKEVFRLIQSNKKFEVLLQQYLESLGELSVNYRRLTVEKGAGVALHAGDAESVSDSLSSFAGLSAEEELAIRGWQKAAKADTERRRKKERGFLRRINALLGRTSLQRLQTTIRASGLLDEKYYLSRYSDVRDSGIDPVRHYIAFGAFELRDPSAEFSTLGYLLKNPDVRATGMNPLFHYIRFGQNEGRTC